VTAEVAAAPAGCCYLVLTHSHDLDLALTTAILQRGDVGWFGLIGSRTKRARFESRLRQRGVDEARLERMVCPIGLPGIQGKQPEIIAVAVVAQLLLQCAVPAAHRLPR
jgi:xanthine dehydrogenase accessory factor